MQSYTPRYAASLFLFVSIFLLQACQQKEKPLTEAEVKSFVKDFERSIEKKDGIFIEQKIDASEIIERSEIGKGRKARSFSDGVVESIQGFGNRLITAIGKTGHCKHVKIYKERDKWHALFRFYGDEGLAYHDMELKRYKGETGIADIFIYTNGENLSKVIGTMYRQTADIPEALLVEEKWFKKLPDMRTMVAEEKYQEAYDAFELIPDEIKKIKAFQVMYLQICSGLDIAIYKKALDDFRILFANEPNMHLVLINAFIVNKEYDKALNSVNLLDKMIDKDPFLDYYRALIYYAAGNNDEALKYLVQTVKYYPDFAEGQLELIAIYLEKGDYTAAKPLIDNYQARKTYEQKTLSELLLRYPDYK